MDSEDEFLTVEQKTVMRCRCFVCVVQSSSRSCVDDIHASAEMC